MKEKEVREESGPLPFKNSKPIQFIVVVLKTQNLSLNIPLAKSGALASNI